MVRKRDAVSTHQHPDGITSRIYSGLLSLEDGVTISESYLGHQAIISFKRVRNTNFPHVFVSSPEQIVTRELKSILRESSPIWADSSDELVCYVCHKSRQRKDVYSVPAVKFSDEPDLHLVKDMSENQVCIECIEKVEEVMEQHIDEDNLRKDFLATSI